MDLILGVENPGRTQFGLARQLIGRSGPVRIVEKAREQGTLAGEDEFGDHLAVVERVGDAIAVRQDAGTGRDARFSLFGDRKSRRNLGDPGSQID